MSERIVNSILSLRLSGITGYSVAYENAPFTPVSGQIYLAESFLSGQRQAIGLSQSDALPGVYQVMVCAPKDGTKGPANIAADAVMALFPRGLRLTRDNVTVTIQQCSRLAAIDGGDRWNIPVSVDYRAFV